jgi:cytochrome c553
MNKMSCIFIVSLGIFTGLSSCKKDKTSTLCESSKTVSFSNQIKPMITSYCISCHGSGGTSPELTTHTSVSSNANQIFNSLKGTGIKLMPLGGPALNDSLITQFSCWISQGKKDN